MELLPLVIIGILLIAVVVTSVYLYSTGNVTPSNTTTIIQIPSSTTAITTTSVYQGNSTFVPGGELANITYCSPGGVNLDLDMFFPNSTNATFPLVVYVHGGGWHSGSNSGLEGAQIGDLKPLASAGFVVASVDYRVAPAYMFPAMIEDVKCAVRYLRAHAAEYRINPNEIGAEGDSAGGHLVALLGTAGPSAGWDVGQWLNESSSVQAVADMFGPTNLTLFISGGHQNATVNSAFGTNATNLTLASPVHYVTPGDPPFLIQQGINDTTVPEAQSITFYNDLIADRNNATLVLVQNSEHEFAPANRNEPLIPNVVQLRAQRIQFFESALK